MKRILIILHAILFCILWQSGNAQENSKNSDSLIIGTWKGNSICQVKNSPCHDEVVVCYITKHDKNSYDFRMNKIVNGVEEDMGILTCTYDNKMKTLQSNQYKGHWVFKLSPSKMHGTLIFNNSLYRIIELEKSK